MQYHCIRVAMYPKPGICSAAVSPVHMHQRLALATRASCASRLWRVGRLCGPLRKSTCRTLAQPRPSRFYMSAVGSSAIDNSSAQDSGYSQSDSHVAEDLVQYIVLRKDLWTSLNWPLGSIIAQACHASTAALWLSRDTPTTSAYCALPNLDDMHKVSEPHCRFGKFCVTVSSHLVSGCKGGTGSKGRATAA